MDGQLLYEEKGNTELHYLYDANGSLRGIQTVGEIGTVTTYYVVTNTRGDITRIYNEVGELQVLYSYDSWGKVLSIKDGNGNEITSDNHIGKLNSLRYRGYYYDDETGLYYLQSRYYDPEVKRFINADTAEILNVTQGELISHNLFAYCSNNPVNNSDPSGYWYKFNQKWNSVYNMGVTLDNLIGVIGFAIGLSGATYSIRYILAKNAKGAIFESTRKLLKKASINLAAYVIKGIVDGLARVLDFSFGKAIAKVWDKLDAHPGNGICEFNFRRKK